MGHQLQHLGAHAVHLEEPARRLAFALEHAAQSVLVALAVREILGHLGEPAMGTIPGAQRRDDHARPEPGAVLAHPPALVLDPADVQSAREQPIRQARARVLLGIEDREVQTDGFVNAVSLQPLGPKIPTGDDSRLVEQEDGVVRNTAHQQPKPFLAFAQHLLATPAFAQVASDLAETDQATIGAPQCRDQDAGPEHGAILAHPPPLVRQMTLRSRDRKFTFGLPLFGVGGQIERLEVPSQDLAGRVPVDGLSTGVPRHDAALGVECVDRIILDAVDQQRQQLGMVPTPRCSGVAVVRVR